MFEAENPAEGRQNMSVVTVASSAMILTPNINRNIAFANNQFAARFQVSGNSSQTCADLVFRSQSLEETQVEQLNDITSLKTSYHGTAFWKESSTVRLRFCLLGPLASLLLLVFQIHFLCKWARVISAQSLECCSFIPASVASFHTCVEQLSARLTR